MLHTFVGCTLDCFQESYKKGNFVYQCYTMFLFILFTFLGILFILGDPLEFYGVSQSPAAGKCLSWLHAPQVTGARGCNTILIIKMIIIILRLRSLQVVDLDYFYSAYNCGWKKPWCHCVFQMCQLLFYFHGCAPIHELESNRLMFLNWLIFIVPLSRTRCTFNVFTYNMNAIYLLWCGV